MRIAHFVQRYPPALGGSEAYFGRLSRYLAAQGHAVTVFTTTALNLEAFWQYSLSQRIEDTGIGFQPGVSQEKGVTVHRYSPRHWPGRRYLLKALSLIPWRYGQCLTLPVNPICPAMFRDAGRTEPRFDVVHATTFPYAFPIACGLRLARRQGIPFLLTPFLHLGDPDDPADRTRRQYLSPPLLYLLRQADRVFAHTELERAALLEVGIPENRIVKVGLGVEAAECTGGQRDRARRAWGIDDSAIVVGHLANLSWEKGSIDLLRAAEQAWARGAAFHLVLAGPAMARFRAFQEKIAPVLDKVRFVGVLDDEQKRDFFAAIDLFALPSRSDSFGLVLLEAWANGLPNIAYRAGGPAELIRHEQDGLLVKCGDIKAFAAALERLVLDAGMRRLLGEAGRQRCASDFLWRDKLLQVYTTYAAASRSLGNGPQNR